jgi:hypothetical protein
MKYFETNEAQIPPVDTQPQVGLEFGIVGARREHFFVWGISLSLKYIRYEKSPAN